MPLIVGDSHTNGFLPYRSFNLSVAYIGARTAHQLQEHPEVVHPLIPRMQRERTIFFLGEIDCRLHIYSQVMTRSITVWEAVSTTVGRYTSYLQQLKADNDLDLSVMSVVPAGLQDNFYNKEHYASQTVRKYITLMFNLSLKLHAEQYQLGYINIFKLLVDENFDRKASVVKDVCHCNYSEAVVREILKSGGVR